MRKYPVVEPWPIKPFVMTDKDKEFADHLNSLSEKEQQMINGLSLGGMKIELTTEEIVDQGIAACPPELLQKFLANM